MAGTDQRINTGLYVPTTEIFDVISGLQTSDVSSPEFKELLIRLAQQVNRINLALNNKVSGLYFEEEFLNGKLWSNFSSDNPENQSQGFHFEVNTGALAVGVNTIAHGLTIGSTWRTVFIYGSASDRTGTNYQPIPNGDNMTITVDGTNIVITNNTAIAFTDSRVVLEYVKNG